MKEFLFQKMDVIYFDQLINSYRLSSKKNSISLSSKVDFFLPLANFLTSPLRKEQRISSNFFSNERAFKVY